MLPSLQPVNLLEVKNILPADPVECQNVDLPAVNLLNDFVTF